MKKFVFYKLLKVKRKIKIQGYLRMRQAVRVITRLKKIRKKRLRIVLKEKNHVQKEIGLIQLLISHLKNFLAKEYLGKNM